MNTESAGLLMYRVRNGRPEFLLVHPGGPFYKNKDTGAWTIPKGEIEPGEEALATARREFEEETGFKAEGPFLPLTPVKQKSGKVVKAWAFAGDCDPGALKSNMFSLEWPPHSGRKQEFPEVDRAGWFGLVEAREKMNPAQVDFLDELVAKLKPNL